MRFTRDQKIQALQREIAFRRSVYPARVEKGKMTTEQADYEISIMEEILDDYVRLTEPGDALENRLDSFLAEEVARARERGTACVIPSSRIMEVTGCPPRKLGHLMSSRGWVRIWFSAGTRGWMLPASKVNESASSSNAVTAEPPTNSNAVTAEPPTNSNAVTAEPPTNSNAVTAEPPTDSNAVTAEPPTDSNAVTAEPPTDSKPVIVEAPSPRECDHRLYALRDLAQRMDVYLWHHLALQMVEKIQKENLPLCGRCALVKNTLLSTRYGFTASDVRKRVLEELSAMASPKPRQPEDLFALIPEEVRAQADMVVEILNLLGGEATQLQLEAALRKRGYRKSTEAYDVLLRVKPALAEIVEVRRGKHCDVWRLK